MQKITVYLIDEQVLFRKGMRFILSNEQDIDVIGESTSYDDAHDYIESRLPNMVIVNINQNTSWGIQVIRSIRQSVPMVALIPVIDIVKEEDLLSAMKSGVSACINKDINSDELLSLVRDVGKGSKPIIKELCRPTLATRVLAELESIDNEIKETTIQLTQVEADILRNISAGKSHTEITSSLGLNREAMIFNLESVFSKLVANNQRIESVEVMDRLRQLSDQYARNITQTQSQLTQAIEIPGQTAIENKTASPQDVISMGDEEVPAQDKARSELVAEHGVAELMMSPVPPRLKLTKGNMNQSKKRKLKISSHAKPEERLIHVLKDRGYEVEESARLTGVSGVVHTLDIFATRDDLVVKHFLAINVFRTNQSKEDSEVDEICNFDAITDDIGIHNKIIIAIPKLSPRAQKVAEAQKIRVLGINDLC